jgi:hypothetical protein
VRSKAPHDHDLVRPTSDDGSAVPASQLPGKSAVGPPFHSPGRGGDIFSELRMATPSFSHGLLYLPMNIRNCHGTLHFHKRTAHTLMR